MRGIGNHNELSPIRQDSDLVWLTCCCYICYQMITGYTIDHSSIFYGHAIIVVTNSGFEINYSVTVSMDQFQSITNPFKTHSLSHVPLFVPCSVQQLRLLFLLLSPHSLTSTLLDIGEATIYIYLTTKVSRLQISYLHNFGVFFSSLSQWFIGLLLFTLMVGTPPPPRC